VGVEGPLTPQQKCSINKKLMASQSMNFSDRAKTHACMYACTHKRTGQRYNASSGPWAIKAKNNKLYKRMKPKVLTHKYRAVWLGVVHCSLQHVLLAGMSLSLEH